jgi:hypothetical protein
MNVEATRSLHIGTVPIALEELVSYPESSVRRVKPQR